MKIVSIVKAAILLSCVFICFVANAQKLPRVQKVSVRAPHNVRVDGRPIEWNNQFQAFNRSTDVFYTMANDDDKLYLVIHADRPEIISKLIVGSFTLAINHSVSKKDDKAVSFTFPLFDRYDKKSISVVPKKSTENAVADRKHADSLLVAYNTLITAKAKVILIKGVPELQDTVISVYNLEGIKVAHHISTKYAYTCELALPLKYLNVTGKFAYHLILNGGQNDLINVTIPPDKIKTMDVRGDGRIDIQGDGPEIEQYNFLNSPTDFWGVYTLAKK